MFHVTLSRQCSSSFPREETSRSLRYQSHTCSVFTPSSNCPVRKRHRHPPLSLSHSHPPLSVAMPQSVRRGDVDVWARQIQVFIERSYEMGEESHYLLIKYWFLATQVLTSKLIWADPWDQRLEVCVSAPMFVCERKKDWIGKQHQVEQRQRNYHKTHLEDEWLKFQCNDCGKCGRHEGKGEWI